MAVSWPSGAHAASLTPRAAARPAEAAAKPATRPQAPVVPAPQLGPAPPYVPTPPLRRSRRRGPGFRAQTGAALLVALVTGFAAWASLLARDDRARPPAGDLVVAVGGVSVAVPPDWRAATRPDGVVPGLDEPAAILEPYPGMRLYAVVTEASDGIPPALRDLTGPLGPGRPAHLAGRPALAYPARPVGGDRVAEVTVARSPSGALVVACIARSASFDLAAGCADDVGPAPGLG
jgi:hypothetical protein